MGEGSEGKKKKAKQSGSARRKNTMHCIGMFLNTKMIADFCASCTECSIFSKNTYVFFLLFFKLCRFLGVV